MVAFFRTLIISLFLSIIGFTSLFSQSLNDRLQQLSGDAAGKYVAPAFNCFGANINGGWLTTPPKNRTLGLDVEFGFVGMGSNTEDGTNNFSTVGSFRFSKDQALKLTTSVKDEDVRNIIIEEIIQKDYSVHIEGPTISGSSSDKVYVTFAPNGSEEFVVKDPKYPFPVHVNLPSQRIDLGVKGILDGYPVLPAAVPQLKIGTAYGTRAILRFVPGFKVHDDFGKLSYLGFGLQHNPAVWFTSKLPVDISAGFLLQSVKVENLLRINTASFGLNVSRDFGFGWLGLTPFAGFMVENSTLNVSYSQTIDTDAGQEKVNINFDLAGENKTRLNTGLNVRLLFINLIADYNFSRKNSFTGGILFNFGF